MFQIDLMSRKPIYEQITEQTEAMIMTGLLQPGQQMPSVRKLSIDLSVNPNTIQRAYNELINKGIILSVSGRGSFVSKDSEKIIGKYAFEKIKTLKSIVNELKLSGIKQQQIIDTVVQVYSDGGSN